MELTSRAEEHEGASRGFNGGVHQFASKVMEIRLGWEELIQLGFGPKGTVH